MNGAPSDKIMTILSVVIIIKDHNTKKSHIHNLHQQRHEDEQVDGDDGAYDDDYDGDGDNDDANTYDDGHFICW